MLVLIRRRRRGRCGPLIRQSITAALDHGGTDFADCVGSLQTGSSHGADFHGWFAGFGGWSSWAATATATVHSFGHFGKSLQLFVDCVCIRTGKASAYWWGIYSKLGARRLGIEGKKGLMEKKISGHSARISADIYTLECAYNPNSVFRNRYKENHRQWQNGRCQDLWKNISGKILNNEHWDSPGLRVLYSLLFCEMGISRKQSHCLNQILERHKGSIGSKMHYNGILICTGPGVKMFTCRNKWTKEY